MGVRVIFPYLWLITCKPHLLMLIRKVLSYPANKNSPHSYCEKKFFFFKNNMFRTIQYQYHMISKIHYILCVSSVYTLFDVSTCMYWQNLRWCEKKNLIYVNDLKIWKIHVQSELIKVNRYMKHPTIRW